MGEGAALSPNPLPCIWKLEPATTPKAPAKQLLPAEPATAITIVAEQFSAAVHGVREQRAEQRVWGDAGQPAKHVSVQ